MLIPARVKKIIKDDILVGKYNMFDIEMNINEIGIDLKLNLAKYDISDSADAFNIELFGGCAEFCEGKTILMNGIDVDSKTLALIVSNLFIDALVKSSEKGAPFKVDVSLPKDKKKAFEDELKEYQKGKKQLAKDKENIIEINAKTIMESLDRIEKKIQPGNIVSGETLIDKKETYNSNVNAPIVDVDPNGNLQSNTGLKRASLNISR